MLGRLLDSPAQGWMLTGAPAGWDGGAWVVLGFVGTGTRVDPQTVVTLGLMG